MRLISLVSKVIGLLFLSMEVVQCSQHEMDQRADLEQFPQFPLLPGVSNVVFRMLLYLVAAGMAEGSEDVVLGIVVVVAAVAVAVAAVDKHVHKAQSQISVAMVFLW